MIRVICACVPVSQVLHLLDNFVPAVTHAKHLAESAAGLRKAAEQQSVDIETHESGQCTCISCASVWRHRQGCRALYRSLLKQDALQAAPQAERGGRPAALSTGPLPALQSQICEDAIRQGPAYHSVIHCSLQHVCHLGLRHNDEVLGITLQLLMQLIEMRRYNFVLLKHPAASAAASAHLVGNYAAGHHMHGVLALRMRMPFWRQAILGPLHDAGSRKGVSHGPTGPDG